MQRFILGAAFVLACSGTAAAQSTTVKSETKVEVKDGRDVTVTGCLARPASGTGYVLNDVQGSGVSSRSYLLVGDDDLDRHLGHMIEVKGKASNLGDDGEVEVKTKTKIERDDADDEETQSTTRLEGNLSGVPYLGVKSVKMVRANCS